MKSFIRFKQLMLEKIKKYIIIGTLDQKQYKLNDSVFPRTIIFSAECIVQDNREIMYRVLLHCLVLCRS